MTKEKNYSKNSISRALESVWIHKSCVLTYNQYVKFIAQSCCQNK